MFSLSFSLHFSQFVFLFQFLPISVSTRFLSVIPWAPLFLGSSLICLSLLRSLLFSLCFHFPVSGLVLCLPVSMCFTHQLLGLSLPVYLILVSLSPFLSLPLFLIISWPFSAPKDRSFQSPDPNGIGVWPRECPLYSHCLVTELEEGNVQRVGAPLPSSPAVGYGHSLPLCWGGPNPESAGGFSQQCPFYCLLNEVVAYLGF